MAHVLASAIRIAVLEVDARGSNGRGEKWEKEIFGKLGDVDSEDHIQALK